MAWLDATIMFSMETGASLAHEWELYSDHFDGVRSADWPWETAASLLCGSDPLQDVMRLVDLREETERAAGEIAAYAATLDTTDFRSAVERLEAFLARYSPRHAVTG